MKLDINIQVTDRDTLEALIGKLEELEKEHSGNCTLLKASTSHYDNPLTTEEVDQIIPSLGNLEITDGYLLSSSEKLELTKELDEVVGRYMNGRYEVSLIFPSTK